MARKIIFGSYDTDTTWGLTLTSWQLSAPSYRSSFVQVPGRDGDLDLSTSLTDGEPRYNNRELVATFEISTSTRANRETLFRTIVNALDGRRLNITLPDDATHYIAGRLQVALEYNDLAHGALTIKGNCEPWRFAATAKTATLTATSTAQTSTLANAGRRLLVPTIVVSGEGASVVLAFGSSTWTLSAGTYALPGLLLQMGNNTITYSGSGSAELTWREAVL